MKTKLFIKNEEIEYNIIEKNREYIKFEYNDQIYQYSLISKNENGGVIHYLGENINVLSDRNYLQVNGMDALVQRPSRDSKMNISDDSQNEMNSPMPGKIVKVLVQENSQVKKGDGLIIMEAMKMEHTIKANANGIIKKIYCEEGSQVEGSVVLIEIDSE